MLLTKAEFQHPAEEDFVSLISSHQIDWLYKPVSFTLAKNNSKSIMRKNVKHGNIKHYEPDFYLPEWDLFVDVVTPRKKLATIMNHKVRAKVNISATRNIRAMRNLYPRIKIELVRPPNFQKLLENLI